MRIHNTDNNVHETLEVRSFRFRSTIRCSSCTAAERQGPPNAWSTPWGEHCSSTWRNMWCRGTGTTQTSCSTTPPQVDTEGTYGAGEQVNTDVLPLTTKYNITGRPLYRNLQEQGCRGTGTPQTSCSPVPQQVLDSYSRT
jgi:hypothetical protein